MHTTEQLKDRNADKHHLTGGCHPKSPGPTEETVMETVQAVAASGNPFRGFLLISVPSIRDSRG